MSDVDSGASGAVVDGTNVAGGGDAAGSPPETSTEAFDLEALAREVMAGENDGVGDDASTGNNSAVVGDEEPPVAKKDEPKKPQTKEEVEAELEKLSGAFAKLTAQDRRLKARAAEHKADVQKFEAEKQSFEAERQNFQAEREGFQAQLGKAKQSVEECLKLGGWSMDDVANWILNDGKVPTEKLIRDMEESTKAELEKLRKEKEEARAQFEREQTELEQRRFDTNLQTHLVDAVKGYKYLSRLPMDTEVFPGVKKYLLTEYQKGNKGVAVEDALRYFEQRLSDMAATLGVAAVPESEGAVKSAQPAAAKPETPKPAPITNRDASLRSVRPSVEETDEDEIDDAERIRRAVAAL